jgi:hypothetical protein
MPKSLKYRGYVLYLEELKEGECYFVTIYNRESQLDYTPTYNDSDEAYENAKKTIDKWTK